MNNKNKLVIILALALILPASMMILVAMTGVMKPVAPPRPESPCDIYAAAGYPCVAAHSSTRALYASYNGPLYQVMRQSDGRTLEIGVAQPLGDDPGGYADAAAQDAFCANTLCWITAVYDQSGNANHLVQAPPGTFRGPATGGFNTLPIADMAPVTIMGHKAYGVYIIPGMGLRNNDAKGLAINDEPQSIYMVCDGTHFDSGCCFNYGNTSTNSRAVGRGTMETVYFGTATAWGSGSGPGPWIMSDMEAGLFSGYDSKQNVANPTIDSWRFVTGVVNGGGGNQWEIRGGNAQEEGLTIFYSGPRPGSRENNYYYPMHRKGAVQLGNGGDNGNGSAGTFYEGVMTSGFPTGDTHNKVHTNIVAARYDVPHVSLSRITTFTPGSSQEVTEIFTNTTGYPVKDIMLGIVTPKGWKAVVTGTKKTVKKLEGPIMPGAGIKATFTVTSPATTGGGFLTGNTEWKNQGTGLIQSETSTHRLRNVFPVKINEVRFETGDNPTNQFIELYNAGDRDVDLSNWSLINTRSMWAPVKLATIPAGTKISARGFYLLGLAGSGLAAPASRGDTIINIRSIAGLETGQQIDIEGEVHTIVSVGTAATPLTTISVPVSTGPWLTIPAGSTNLPVTNAEGFVVGQKIGINPGGNFEVATVKAVGKAATLTTMAAEAKAGETIIKVAANSNITEGDMLTIGTGGRKELVKVKRLIKVVAAPARGSFGQGGPGNNTPGEVELATPLKFDHSLDTDVSDPGTGIRFSPATRFVHKSGEAVQALGSGIKLERALEKRYEAEVPLLNLQTTSGGYQGAARPNQWYGSPLSSSAGSLALMDASGTVLVDAIVYGSQQSNSSANGTITSPEIATLEGDQSQGGCITVVPGSFSGSGQFIAAAGKSNRSAGRFPDGADTDNNCSDFYLQNTIILLTPASAGSNNIKVASVAELSAGQEIIIGIGTVSETAVIKYIGTPGGATLSTSTKSGVRTVPVTGIEGFKAGQPITIDEGTNLETAVIASIAAGRRRFGSRTAGPADSVTFTMPLKHAHDQGALVSGSGISLEKPLSRAHDAGTQVADNLPTPGAPNKYFPKQGK